MYSKLFPWCLLEFYAVHILARVHVHQSQDMIILMSGCILIPFRMLWLHSQNGNLIQSSFEVGHGHICHATMMQEPSAPWHVTQQWWTSFQYFQTCIVSKSSGDLDWQAWSKKYMNIMSITLSGQPCIHVCMVCVILIICPCCMITKSWHRGHGWGSQQLTMPSLKHTANAHWAPYNTHLELMGLKRLLVQPTPITIVAYK